MVRALALVVVLLFAAPVSAQTSAADREEARALFAAGQAAVDGGRWTDALDAFHRAYELTHAPSALFNAAFALRALGRYQEAAAAFEELLELDGTRRAMRTEATGYLQEVRERIAHVSLTGLPEDAITTVRLDAEGVPDDGTRPLVISADPGHHAIDVTLAGHERFEWSGELAGGQSLDVPVSLPAIVVAAATTVDAPRETTGPGDAPPGSGSVVDEAWFWVVIGVAAAGIAGGIVGGVVADDQAQLRADTGMTVHL
jgi:hypothetical protein